MTPPSRPGCPLGPYMSRFRKCILGLCFIFIPARPVGPPVARSDVVLWAPRLEIGRRTSPARAEPTAASVSPKLAPCKSLSECCAARAGSRPGWGVGWCLALEIGRGTSPTRAKPTAARVWLKLVSCKSLSECCEARAGRRPERAPSQGWW